MEKIIEMILPVISTTATALIGYLVYKLKKHEEKKEAENDERVLQLKIKDEAIIKSLLALTRDRINQGYRYYRKQGSISTQDMETMVKLYDAYHALGGNGTITAIYKKITALPIKEE